MSRFWSAEHSHDHPWSTVARAYWGRYPNPNSSHVFSEDFIEVKVLSEDRIYFKRFIHKTNSLPSWGKHFFSAKRVPMIEEIVVDRKEQTFTTYNRNIGLRYFMGVNEKVVFRPDESDPLNKTRVEKSVWIDSSVFGFQAAIRKFGIDRFKKNCVKATDGFEWAIQNRFMASSQSNNATNAAKKQPHSNASSQNPTGIKLELNS